VWGKLKERGNQAGKILEKKTSKVSREEIAGA